MAVDLLLLRTFAEVVQRGSFTGAADALGVAQPTVSLRVKRLEDMVGAPLIKRSRLALSTTETGERLYAAVAELLDAATAVDRLLLSFRSENRNRIRLGCVPVGSAFRNALFERFIQANPDVLIEVDEHNRRALMEGLRSGTIDVAFDYNRDDPSLEMILIAQLEMGLIIPPSSPLYGHGPIEASALAGMLVAIFRRELDPVFHDQIAGALQANGATLLTCPEWTIAGLTQFARHRMIPTLAVPDIGAPTWPPEGLAFRAIRRPSFPWNFHALRAKDGARPIVRRFWSFLQAELQC